MLGGILPAALRDAVVPPLLLNSTCSIGVRVGAVSATVAALAKGVAMRMMLGKIQGTLMALVGVVGLGVGALAYRGTAQEKAEKQVESPAQVVPPTVASEGTAEKFEVRTTNFQVVASSKRVARLIGEAAERQRKDIAIKWLNEELPTWDKPCSITVEQMEHPHGGYSSFSFNDEGKLRKPSLMLWGTVEQLLSCELPHEVTHLVLADHFGRPIPRWANEGCAMLAEDDEQQAHYVKVMKQIQENSIGLAPLGKLLPKMDGYADLAIFNAQARSLTEFLIKKGEHRRFLAFVKSGMEKDWDSACQSVYGFKNVEELEVSWLRAIGNKELQAPVKGQATQSEQKGPAPRFVEALFVENQLLLYDANDYHEFATSLRLMEGKAVLVVSGWPRSGWNSVDPNPVRAFRADGKPLTSEQWQKALAKKQWILVAGDAEPVNPCYLKLLRDDTIVLILLNVRPDVTVKSVE
jgi:hypothetical protein